MGALRIYGGDHFQKITYWASWINIKVCSMGISQGCHGNFGDTYVQDLSYTWMCKLKCLNGSALYSDHSSWQSCIAFCIPHKDNSFPMHFPTPYISWVTDSQHGIQAWKIWFVHWQRQTISSYLPTIAYQIVSISSLIFNQNKNTKCSSEWTEWNFHINQYYWRK